MHGREAGFTAAIYFPKDAVIDSASYAKGLIQAALRTGKVRLFENCPPVIGVSGGGDWGWG